MAGTWRVYNRIAGRISGPVVQAGHIGELRVETPAPRKRLLTWLAFAGVVAVGTAASLMAWGVIDPSGSQAAPPAKACLAKADPSLKSGHVWASRSHDRSYTPADAYQCNSAGGVNTVRREGTGRYVVRFPGLGVDGGTVEVTSTDEADRVCAVRNWGRAPGNPQDQDVLVGCADRDGTPADATFAAAFLFTMGRSGPLAYVRADQPTEATQVPDMNHQYNLTGDVNSIDRERLGVHVVFLPGLQKSYQDSRAGGIVKVTPLGDVPALCAPQGWRPWHNDKTGKDFLMVRVGCATPRGTPLDAAFTLTYTVDLASEGEPRIPGAYVWATEPAAAEHTPTREYQYNSTHTLNMIVRTERGHYTVHLPGLTREGGNPQVSAYGSDALCGVTGWRPVREEQQADIVCRAPTGEPVDTRFSFLYRQ